MQRHEIALGDLQLLSRTDSPDLAEAIISFLEQSDPSQPDDPPAGSLSVEGLTAALSARSLRYKSPAERQKIAQDLWSRFLHQPDLPPPPRFLLPDLLIDLYERGTAPGRAALIEIARRARLRFGLWAGLKRIYKLAEVRHDAEMLGALAWRFDVEMTRGGRRDVGPGTLIYLRRRAWRYLRQLGQSTPELYPQFVVQVLRHYDSDRQVSGSWVANHVFVHTLKRGWTAHHFRGKLPDDLIKNRAFDEAWKRTPEPLLLLLEMAQADAPARFAIQGLRKDFPAELRRITPAWLARLASRPLASAHEFLIEVLQGSPDFHQGKLRGLGLHETVLLLLVSPSQKARTYAIEYARAHAGDLAGLRLIELLSSDYKDTVTYAVATLKARPPRELGYELLGRLLGHRETKAFAQKSLNEAYDLKDLPESFLLDMVYGEDEGREWVSKALDSAYGKELGPDFWKRVLADRRQENSWDGRELALDRLEKFKLPQIGAAWLLDRLTEGGDIGERVSDWLEKADALPGLDVERVKGLVFNARYRRLALKILGNTKLVKPRELGLSWLLALARRADPQLHEFAHKYLLEHWKPADFSDSGDKEAGIARLFALATGEKEPESVRLFAQTYLRCHHPGISSDQPEAKALQLKPQLPRGAYTAERVWPALFDARADVRRFGVAIAGAELRSWGYQGRVYELAESDAKEVRALAFDALLKVGEAGADLACTLKADELDAAKVFAMTESRQRSSREVAMELIRRHYGRLGGAERLAWLMQTPDREVRLFAVRLLWEKHRPRHLPPGWRPHKPVAADGAAEGPAGAAATAGSTDEARFADVAALRDFLRRVLYGVPPGRSMEPRDDTEVRRRLPASVAKRHVIEVVRDLALGEPAFAGVVAPVLGEFTGSLARGEWQACLAALTQLQKAHPGIFLEQVLEGAAAPGRAESV